MNLSPCEWRIAHWLRDLVCVAFFSDLFPSLSDGLHSTKLRRAQSIGSVHSRTHWLGLSEPSQPFVEVDIHAFDSELAVPWWKRLIVAPALSRSEDTFGQFLHMLLLFTAKKLYPFDCLTCLQCWRSWPFMEGYMYKSFLVYAFSCFLLRFLLRFLLSAQYFCHSR